jgi:citrate synthase
VLNMLAEIGSAHRIPAFIESVKSRRAQPPGFGHRVYRTYDPRAQILRRQAEKVFRVVSRPRIFDVALELDEQASRDPYFVDRGLYPIID